MATKLKGSLSFESVLYLAGVLDYLSSDILKLAAIYTANCKETSINEQNLEIAVGADPSLFKLFQRFKELPNVEASTSHINSREAIREALLAEREFIDKLNTIKVVFASLFESQKDVLFSQDTIDTIFSRQIDEVIMVAQEFASALEDALSFNKASERNTYTRWKLLEIVLTGDELETFCKFADDVDAARRELSHALSIAEVKSYLHSVNPQCLLAVKYELPNLLLEPLYHLHHYVACVETFLENSRADPALQGDCEGFLEVLQHMRTKAARITQAQYPFFRPKRNFNRMPRVLALQSQVQSRQIQSTIEGWEGPDLGSSAAQLYHQGWLNMEGDKHRTRRYVFAFDGIILCCKENTERKDTKYRFKETYNTHNLRVNDVPDTVGAANIIILTTFEGRKIKFRTESAEEKADWLAAFCRPATSRWTMQLFRERQGSLEIDTSILPDWRQHGYDFLEPDSDNNIRNIKSEREGRPDEIKGGTLVKLVERLTYPQYSNPTFIRHFLITYRSFCKPQKLWEMLMWRFNVPPPKPRERTPEEEGDMDLPEKLDSRHRRRFMHQYAIPVRHRVAAVVKHWVEHHFYDFKNDKKLFRNLLEFAREMARMSSINSEDSPVHEELASKMVYMRSACEGIVLAIKRQQKRASEALEVVWSADEVPPPMLRLPVDGDFPPHILTLHPIELARQLTIIDSRLYRAIRPSELVGEAWTKKDKDMLAPNVLAMINRSTMVTNWVVRSVIECSDLHERAEVFALLCEMLRELRELKNFNGITNVMAGIGNSAVRRLKHTIAEMPSRQQKVFEECDELVSAKNYSLLRKELSQVNPPCIPFLGMYLTDITFIEQGSSDFLKAEGADGGSVTTELINFGKRRLVARSTREIQLYQDQPYCLEVEPTIEKYLLEFPALPGCPLEMPQPTSPSFRNENDAYNNMAYDLSHTYEPRGVDRADLPPGRRLFPDVRLQKAHSAVLVKSVRVSRQRTDSSAADERRQRTDSVSSAVSTTDGTPPPLVPRQIRMSEKHLRSKPAPLPPSAADMQDMLATPPPQLPPKPSHLT